MSSGLGWLRFLWRHRRRWRSDEAYHERSLQDWDILAQKFDGV